MNYFGLAMIVVGGLIMFFNSTRDININSEHLQDIRADIQSIRLDMSKDKKELESSDLVFKDKIAAVESKLSGFESQISATHDHLARVTKQQMKFKNTIFPRQMNPKIKASPEKVSPVQPSGAIPLEIIGTDVKLIRKENKWKKTK